MQRLSFLQITPIFLLFLLNIFNFSEVVSNLSIKLILLAISCIAYLYIVVLKKPKESLKYLYLLSILLVFFGILLSSGIDKKMFLMSGFEQNQLAKRNEYYLKEVNNIYSTKPGSFYLRRVKFYIDRIAKEISYPLDVKKYFGPTKDSYYPILTLFIFVVGLVWLLVWNSRKTIYLFLFSLILSLMLVNEVSVLLFIPLINLSILIGLHKILSLAKDKFNLKI